VATLGLKRTECDFNLGPGNDFIDWRSLASTISNATLSPLRPQDLRPKSNSSTSGINTAPTPFTTQQSLPCPSQTSNDNCFKPRTTNVPSDAPGICGAVHNPHADGLIDNSTTSSHPIDQPTAVDPADLLCRPQTGAAVLSQKQLHTTSPEEARKAIRVVIEIFQQQPSGSLEFQDCIALGKLEEKLRRMVHVPRSVSR